MSKGEIKPVITFHIVSRDTEGQPKFILGQASIKQNEGVSAC